MTDKELDFYFQVKEKDFKEILSFSTDTNYHLSHCQSLFNEMKVLIDECETYEQLKDVLKKYKTEWNDISYSLIEANDCIGITLRELSNIFMEQTADEWKNDLK